MDNALLPFVHNRLLKLQVFSSNYALGSKHYHPSQHQQDWTQGFLVGHNDTPDIFWHFCPLI